MTSAPSPDLSRIRHWVFDLDNTLYPPEARLFDQIETKMTDYVMRELGLPQADANALRDRYWREHGTTLAGLMRNQNIAAAPFLDEVHDIDLGGLSADPLLAARIAALPGRKIFYTNGSRRHAERVLEARGLTDVMDVIFGIEDANHIPKPDLAAFERIFGLAELPGREAAMFEDDPRNLLVPHQMGLATVHVAPVADPAPHIHHHTDDLSAFLSRIV